MSTFTIITLTGQFAGATGGLLYAQLSSTMTNAALGTIQAGTTYQAGIGADGTVSLPLPANDDPGSTPGTAWRVTGMLAPSGRYTATVQLLRAGGGVQNLATLDPAAGTTPYLSYIPLPQKGTANGVATLDSSGLVPAGQLPAGGGGGAPLSNATPLADTPTGTAGTAGTATRGDHSHPQAAALAHAASHATGGSDALTPAGIGAATVGALAGEASTARAAEGANATAITNEATTRATSDTTNATALNAHTSAMGNVHGLDDITLLVQDPTAGGLLHTLRVTLAALMTAIATKIGNPLTALGDLFVGGAAGVPSRLPVGTLGQTLTVGSGGVPAWAAAGGGGFNPAADNAFTAAQTTTITDASTNTVAVGAIIEHASSATPATNFAVRLLFRLQSSTTIRRTAAGIRAAWADATDSSRTSELIMSTNNPGTDTLVERLRVHQYGVDVIGGGAITAAYLANQYGVILNNGITGTYGRAGVLAHLEFARPTWHQGLAPPADPEVGWCVVWYDSATTLLKIKKNIGGTITTVTIA